MRFRGLIRLKNDYEVQNNAKTRSLVINKCKNNMGSLPSNGRFQSNEV